MPAMMLLFVIVFQLRKYEEWMVVGIWLAIGNLHLDVFSGIFNLFAPGGVQAVCCARTLGIEHRPSLNGTKYRSS